MSLSGFIDLVGNPNRCSGHDIRFRACPEHIDVFDFRNSSRNPEPTS